MPLGFPMNSLSILKRDRSRKKLRQLLSHAEDEAFCQMIWAVDALQSGRAEAAARHLRFPAEAATSDMISKFAVYKWYLETLVGHLLTTPKYNPISDVKRATNCSQFATVAKVVNLLRNLEDAEASIYLRRFSILNEMHRIGQRQFPWQRGFVNGTQFIGTHLFTGKDNVLITSRAHTVSQSTNSLL